MEAPFSYCDGNFSNQWKSYLGRDGGVGQGSSVYQLIFAFCALQQEGTGVIMMKTETQHAYVHVQMRMWSTCGLCLWGGEAVINLKPYTFIFSCSLNFVPIL